MSMILILGTVVLLLISAAAVLYLTMFRTTAPSGGGAAAAEDKPRALPYHGKLAGCAFESGQDIPVTCPTGQRFSEAKLRYGRWDNTICSHPTVTAGTPAVEKTYALPQVQGLSSWTMPAAIASRVTMDDPFYGVLKHYELNYTCV
jgi:hypothetical protein